MGTEEGYDVQSCEIPCKQQIKPFHSHKKKTLYTYKKNIEFLNDLTRQLMSASAY